MSLNKGEIGQPIRINYSTDISLATAELIIEPKVGSTKTFTATIPSSPVVVDGVTLAADEYIEYTTLNASDLDYIGRYRYKGKLTFSSTDVRQSDYQFFTVLA